MALAPVVASEPKVAADVRIARIALRIEVSIVLTRKRSVGEMNRG